mmetsp:Transcript_7284/g.10308  ORF Transcript_7284/g.10308 Transcript_7284/m.10308 type:complete len:98 (-) Transcript_7284:46-339(-)
MGYQLILKEMAALKVLQEAPEMPEVPDRRPLDWFDEVVQLLLGLFSDRGGYNWLVSSWPVFAFCQSCLLMFDLVASSLKTKDTISSSCLLLSKPLGE